MDEKRIARQSAIVYTGFSLALAVLFLILTWNGEYTPVARYGGAIWVFILSMIIAMPVVIPYYRKGNTVK